MGQVDGFVVSVAGPSIQRDLHASFGQIQLVGAGYVLAFAAFLVVGARLGDRHGRRRVFTAGVAAFTATSAMCGLAPTAGLLVAGRFAQGAAAAVMVPQVLALARAMFTEPADQARAIGRYGVVVGSGVVAGVAGGGLLAHLDGWRPVLLVNVPIGLCILAAAGAVRESRGAAGRLDLAGAALAVTGVPALLVPLIFPGTWWPLALAAAALGALVWRQRTAPDPLFPPRVLTTPGMPRSLVTLAVFFAGNSGLFLVVTYYTQTGLGLDPFAAGLLFVPMGLGFVLAQRFTARAGPVAGAGLLAASLLAAAAAAHAPAAVQPGLLALLLAVAGAGQGLVATPLVTAIIATVRPVDAGATSGVATTVTQAGLALGVAVTGAWYRLVLGGTPGDPHAPDRAPLAFTAAAVLLATFAALTCLITYRRRIDEEGRNDSAGGTARGDRPGDLGVRVGEHRGHA